MDEIAADTLALADALGWREFSLIGHSMGGKAIQRVLTRAPSRVKKLVALTPVPASAFPFDEQGWALFAGAAENPAQPLRHHRLHHRQPAVENLDRRDGRVFARMLDARRLRRVSLAWAKTDFSADVKGLPHPVQVIVGAHDPALSADAMKGTYLAWYPNARMEVMDNAGHYPMHETPVALATSIEKFLRG